MPDTNDQPVSNPQSLVDAALGTSPEVVPTTTPPLEPLNSAVVPPTPSVTMGDDTPLAFAIPTPSASPDVPVVPPSVATSTTSPTTEAPSKQSSRIGVVLGGILLLIVAIGGGVFGYGQLTRSRLATSLPAGSTQPNLIAQGGPPNLPLSDDPAVNAANEIKRRQGNGEKLSNEEKDRIAKHTIEETLQALYSKGYSGAVWNGKNIKALLDERDKYYNKAIADMLLETQGHLAAVNANKCTALRNANWELDKTSATDNSGLCTPGKGGGCSLDDGSTAGLNCRVEKIRCKAGGQAGVACNEEKVEGTELTENLTCGSEQIDVICDECGTKPVAFTNQFTGKSCTTNNPPNEEVSPTLTCTDLTHAPAGIPSVGADLLFTCTGASKPVGAVALTYNFRYQLNGGEWNTMATNTANPPKGKLTVAACGTYKVQCRVCGTIAGQKVCSPVWAGATQ